MGFHQTATHRSGKASHHQVGLVRGQFGSVPWDEWLGFLQNSGFDGWEEAGWELDLGRCGNDSEAEGYARERLALAKKNGLEIFTVAAHLQGQALGDEPSAKTLQFTRGEPVAYELMPQRSGSARHYGGENEECTHHDFWVTRNRPDQAYYPDVPKYVAKRALINNADVVLWYSAPMHHEPRSEDGEMVNGRLRGVTHVGWSQFSLRPANVFDRTPFYPTK